MRELDWESSERVDWLSSFDLALSLVGDFVVRMSRWSCYRTSRYSEKSIRRDGVL